jgi:ATP-dependent Lhr-like helicase
VDEVQTIGGGILNQLAGQRRAALAATGMGGTWYVAAERLPELRAVHPEVRCTPPIEPPGSRAARIWTRDDALVELVRGRLAVTGPTTAPALAALLAVDARDVEASLVRLESEGIVLRGSFEERDEWCDRRLLARIHRYTLHRLRAEIEPVAPADFMRFLFVWQHLAPGTRLTGLDGLRTIVDELHGFEAPAAAWERAILPQRLDGYGPALLDGLCLTGEAGWARVSPASPDVSSIAGVSPIALFLRERGTPSGRAQESQKEGKALSDRSMWGSDVQSLADTLRRRGALFAYELASACGMDAARLHEALARAVALGLISSDGFGGLRALMGSGTIRAGRRDLAAGRWSLVRAAEENDREDEPVDVEARAVLRRYGVIFRRLLAREPPSTAWRELVRVFRRLEARGEIRGGRFVAGMQGEQFALPEAVERLREIRRSSADGRPIVVSAADPLNLTGIITAGERVRVSTSGRVLYWDGVPIAALENEFVRTLNVVPPEAAPQVASLLTGRRLPTVLSGYVGAAR